MISIVWLFQNSLTDEQRSKVLVGSTDLRTNEHLRLIRIVLLPDHRESKINTCNQYITYKISMYLFVLALAKVGVLTTRSQFTT